MSCIVIHEDEIGTSFIITLTSNGSVTDLSDVVGVTFYFGKPDGSVTSFSGVVLGDGTTGLVRGISPGGTFDQIGRWTIQILVETADGQWYSDVDTFKVEGNLV